MKFVGDYPVEELKIST